MNFRSFDIYPRIPLFTTLLLFTITFFVYDDFGIRMIFGYAALMFVVLMYLLFRNNKIRFTRMKVLYLILGLVLCAFSTAWGCVCGIRHLRLDWENEVEVIKQGSAVTIYLLPNMFAVMGLTVLMVFLGTRMDHRLLTLVMIVITAVLALLSYLRVLSLCRRES